MAKIQIFMSERHRLCDQMIADSENLISTKDWIGGDEKFKQFSDELNTHLDMEEDILFPAIEDRMGGTSGPTQVMRNEHEEMRDLLQVLQEALESRDKDTFLGNTETLLMLIQQHNMKEEHMLYPMADDLLGTEAEDIVNQMKELIRPNA